MKKYLKHLEKTEVYPEDRVLLQIHIQMGYKDCFSNKEFVKGFYARLKYHGLR